MASHLPLRDTTPPARRWPFISPHFRARRLRARPKPNPRYNGLVSHGDWAADLKLLHRRHSPMLLLLAPCSSLCLSPFTMLPPCFILAAGHGPHPGRAAVEFRPDLLSQRLQGVSLLVPAPFRSSQSYIRWWLPARPKTLLFFLPFPPMYHALFSYVLVDLLHLIPCRYRLIR